MSPLVTRVLPSDQWDRLSPIEPFATKGLPDDPNAWCALIVERDGSIVGTCSVFTAMHWDGWWIDEREPGPSRGLILKHLLAGSLRVLEEAGARQVYTGAESGADTVVDLLTRFGFRPAPGKLFVLQMAEAALALRKEA